MANSVGAPTSPLNPNAQPWPLLHLPHQIIPPTFAGMSPPPLPLTLHYPPAPAPVVPYYYHLAPPPSFTYFYQVPPMVVQQQPVPQQFVDTSTGIRRRRRGGDRRVFRGWKTTVMIRNIPNQFSRAMLVDFLDQICRHENSRLESGSQRALCAYDFVYLPIDFVRGLNLGYAFVNFTSPFFADRIFTLLKGYKWGSFGDDQNNWCDSKKNCRINWARIQGAHELVNHFKNSKFVCDNINYLPVLFTPPRDGSCAPISPTTIGCLSDPVTPRHA